jgi:hypothetical protein
MKTLTTIIAITFSLFTINATAQTQFASSSETVTAATIVEVNGKGIQFEANNNGIFIKWEVANESNTSHFELQVSDDNKSFETIRKVAASDVTTWATNYQAKFMRNYSSVNKVFYRLKTVFSNGTEVYTTATTFQTTTNTGAFVNVR